VLTRFGGLGPCSRCNEPIATARTAALLLAVVAGVAIEAEVLHQLCARARALALGARAEVLMLQDLVGDPKARERLRLFARSAREQISANLVRFANLALRESTHASPPAMLRATGRSRPRPPEEAPE